MSSRNRLIIGLLLGALCLAPAAAFLVTSVNAWHREGWVGLSIIPGSLKPGARLPGGLEDYEPQRVILAMPFAPAARAGIRPGDKVESINSIPLSDKERLSALSKELHSGDEVVYAITRGGQRLTIRTRLESPLRNPLTVAQILVFCSVALAYVVIGLLVFVKRPDDRRAIVFYAFTVTSAVYLLSSTSASVNDAIRGISPAVSLGYVYFGVAFFGLAFLPLILHLSLVFPKERPGLTRWPKTLWWMYLFPLLPVVVTGLLLPLRRLRTYLAGAPPDAHVWVASLAALVLAASAVAVVRPLLRAPRGRRREEFASRPLTMLGAFAVASSATGALFVSSGSPLAAALILLSIVATFFAAGLVGYVVGAVVSLHRSYREANVEEKRQVVWPLWGTMIALGVRLAVTLFGLLFGALYRQLGVGINSMMITAQILEIVSRGLYILIPVSFAIAILKYRLMNIDIIIRKTIAYAILSTIILVLYLGLVGGVGALLVEVTGIRNQTFVITATLFVALIFVPLRNRLQTLTDRNLFRQRYDYAATLEVITTSSRSANDTAALLSTSAEQLQQTLQNRAIVVFVERQREFVAAAKVGVSDTLLGRLSVPESFAALLDRPFDPRRRGLDPETASTLQSIGTVLVVPLAGVGFIAAAARLDTRELDVEDIDFLGRAADTLGSAVDRIRMQAEGADFAQARSIQQALLPQDLPAIPGLDISGRWQPARTMGGDYYDVIRLAEDEVAICIGDVAGKGMPAALLMSGLQAAVRASASSSPRDLCERVRRVVVSSLSGGRFVTFFYATVNTTQMKVRWCNAGHNPPLLVHADGSLEHLESGGPAFSRLLKTPYEESERVLAPGDRLVLFTDGVTEARGADGEMLGDARLENAVIAARHAGAAALEHAVAEAAESFSNADLDDDLTVVVVAVGG